jgi:glutathione S-transferase
MKFFYSATSPYSRKVRMVVLEKGLEKRVELVLVDPFSQDARLEAANPLGKVPALLLDDGSTLFDSPLLCRYLDSLSSQPRLIPRDNPDEWQVIRWEAMADGMTDAAYNLVMERRRPPSQQSPQWLGRWAADIQRVLQVMEGRMGELGADMTLAHLAVGAAIGYLDLRMPETLYEAACPQPAAYPRLLRWYESFRLRPSMRATESA